MKVCAGISEMMLEVNKRKRSDRIWSVISRLEILESKGMPHRENNKIW